MPERSLSSAKDQTRAVDTRLLANNLLADAASAVWSRLLGVFSALEQLSKGVNDVNPKKRNCRVVIEKAGLLRDRIECLRVASSELQRIADGPEYRAMVIAAADKDGLWNGQRFESAHHALAKLACDLAMGLEMPLGRLELQLPKVTKGTALADANTTVSATRLSKLRTACHKLSRDDQCTSFGAIWNSILNERKAAATLLVGTDRRENSNKEFDELRIWCQSTLQRGEFKGLNFILDNSGRVSKESLVSHMDWPSDARDQKAPWDSFRRRVNKKLKGRGWMLSQTKTGRTYIVLEPANRKQQAKRRSKDA